ncbi:MAG: DUF2252 domain-containing protein [Actinomycetota bacterium]|nr:DUF2252 domain-containing protein [Actinomycetota bacterium]
MSFWTDPSSDAARRDQIVAALVEAFQDLMAADPAAFRTKFRKMAADPNAFYRGSACLFYADVADVEDPWADERTSRVWIQGDLHAENFGTYMDGNGILVLDVNDFDEAYLGHFTWDVMRMAASVAMHGWQKALPDQTISDLVVGYANAYVDQVRKFARTDRDHEFSLRLDTTDGVVHDVLLNARLASRLGLLDKLTQLDGFERRFRDGPGVRRPKKTELDGVLSAYAAYQGTVPERENAPRIMFDVKDVVARQGFGVGSAGLPAYNVLIEGYTQALENDIVLSIKQGNVAAPSRVVDDEHIRSYFEHHGHRTAVSQRALQAHADPLLGYTAVGGVGYVVSELSPYATDLDWADLNEPDEIGPVLDYLGRATARIHCVSDADSDQTLVDFETEDAIVSAIGKSAKDAKAFASAMAEFGLAYASRVRSDHALFVDAFREGEITEVAPA